MRAVGAVHRSGVRRHEGRRDAQPPLARLVRLRAVHDGEVMQRRFTGLDLDMDLIAGIQLVDDVLAAGSEAPRAGLGDRVLVTKQPTPVR